MSDTERMEKDKADNAYWCKAADRFEQAEKLCRELAVADQEIEPEDGQPRDAARAGELVADAERYADYAAQCRASAGEKPAEGVAEPEPE